MSQLFEIECEEGWMLNACDVLDALKRTAKVPEKILSVGEQPAPVALDCSASSADQGQMTTETDHLRNAPYTQPRDTRPTRIVAAAVLQSGRVWTGRRHADLIRLVMEDGGEPVGQHHQGFWTDDGRFVIRQAAKSIAIRSGQIPETYRGTLISEDLW